MCSQNFCEEFAHWNMVYHLFTTRISDMSVYVFHNSEGSQDPDTNWNIIVPQIL
jgi:hypothetical protein